jgi:hypothetical protein
VQVKTAQCFRQNFQHIGEPFLSGGDERHHLVDRVENGLIPDNCGHVHGRLPAQAAIVDDHGQKIAHPIDLLQLVRIERLSSQECAHYHPLQFFFHKQGGEEQSGYQVSLHDLGMGLQDRCQLMGIGKICCGPKRERFPLSSDRRKCTAERGRKAGVHQMLWPGFVLQPGFHGAKPR